jgi:hypothetical protein
LGNDSDNRYTSAANHLIGRLGSGIVSATVTAAIWSELQDGSVESGTYVSSSPSVISSSTATLNAAFSTSSQTMVAGEKKTITLSLGRAYGYMYRESFGYSNPTVYLREIP